MWNWWKISFCTAPFLVFGVEWLLLHRALRRPRQRTGRLERALTAVGLLGAMKFIAFQLLGGNAFNPDLPVWLLFAWGWLESVIWVALPVSLATAVLLPPVRWLFKTPRPSGGGAVSLVLALSCALATYGMWDGMRVAPVVEREVTVADLPSAFDGYRIVHLSDLHCSSAARRDKISAIVARANACRPDLVAISGDFVDGFPEERERDLEPLADLHATDGVVGSTGNHEKYWHISRWTPYFEKWNVRMLRNAWLPIRRGDATLAVGGLDDDALWPKSEKKTPIRPDNIFADAPADACRVLVYHRPVGCAFFDREWNVRLQLSGHTHGGAMPIIRQFVARENEGHLRGLYRSGRLALHNSPGTGQWAGFPLRLFNPPEITVLILKRAARPESAPGR